VFLVILNTQQAHRDAYLKKKNTCKYVYLLQHQFNFESSPDYCGDLITAPKRWSIWP